MRPPRLLLASIHDVSPRFADEVDRLRGLMQPHVGHRIAMLVVPNHWGDAPIVPGSPFATRLRGWSDAGSEIFLHGFFHRDDARHAGMINRAKSRFMTAREGEFLGLSFDQAAERIREGRDLIEQVTGKAVAGFVAPAWLYGAGALEALRHSRIPIAEDHLKVWSPALGKKLATGPVLTWASRTPWRLRTSIIAAAALRAAPIPVLRVGVHPPDMRHPALVRSIEKTFRNVARSRRPAAYTELLAT
jgi:hypothetical protein